MAHLNDLNVKLQGKGKIICEQTEHIQEFKSKLNLLLSQIQKDDLTHFANLARFLENNEECSLLEVKWQLYVSWMKNMSQKFELRFSDFNDFKLAFQFLRDPFYFDITNSSKEIATLLSLDKRRFEDDLLSLHSMEQLKVWQNSSVTEMWESILTD